jgi:hypothetical protein
LPANAGKDTKPITNTTRLTGWAKPKGAPSGDHNKAVPHRLPRPGPLAEQPVRVALRSTLSSTTCLARTSPSTILRHRLRSPLLSGPTGRSSVSNTPNYTDCACASECASTPCRHVRSPCGLLSGLRGRQKRHTEDPSSSESSEGGRATGQPVRQPRQDRRIQ